jgi:hypothetical protein
VSEDEIREITSVLTLLSGAVVHNTLEDEV